MGQNMTIRLLPVFTFCALIAVSCGGGSTSSGDGADAPAGSDTGGRTDTGGNDVYFPPGDTVPVDFGGGDFVPVACEEPPYGNGCACESNSDCLGSYCIESSDGFVCTSECLDECPSGWSCKGIAGFGSDIVFVCVPNSKKQCFPCKKDNQCPGGRCIQLEGSGVCAVACSEGDECPAGFACKDTAVEGGSEKLCVPVSGSCECLPDTAGQLRPCSAENDMGTCYGYQECDPAAGWGPCSAVPPVPEECNGLDDDCDGSIDEGLATGGGCLVTNEFGKCQGAYACLGALGMTCQGTTPSAEVCDYKDNNCNGKVDETFTDVGGKYVAFDDCGSCGVSCEFGFPNAKAKCDTAKAVPQCVVDACEPGYFKLNEFQCIPNTASLCEACTTDDNCLFEEAKCAQLSDGTFCTMPCTGGTDCPDGYACQPYGGSNQCVPVTNSCTCNGTNLDLSKSCQKTFPPAPLPGEPSITCYGFQFCTVNGWTDCDMPDEACDGTDNDCNGIKDDPYTDAQGRYVADTNCGQCGNNCTAVNYANASGACNTEKAIPDCMMVCKPGFEDVDGNPANGCECLFDPAPDLPDGKDTDCDGVDGEVGNAVFVAKNGSDQNTGEIGAPMLTIVSAIARAEADSKRDVYVATGVYNESVVLKPGANVYGGYSSDFKTRHVLLYETVIMGGAPTPAKPGAVTVGGVTDEVTTLDGFTLFGLDNDLSGQSSYGIYVRDSGQNLHVHNCHVFGGDGGDGAPGANGQDGGDGAQGAAGQAAYLYNSTVCNVAGALKTGGAGGSKTCGATSTSGGKGGDAYCGKWDVAPSSAENGVAGSGPGAGAGGAAGWDGRFYDACSLCNVPSETHPMDGADGKPGADGSDGSKGIGCSQPSGAVNNGLWQPADAFSGQPGSHGGGGGGGGAGAAVDNQISCTEQIGGTGGGGGAGACAGTGGAPGTGGGGSFALYLYFSLPGNTAPTIAGNFFQAGIGGSGGVGGNGGTGGVGGVAGAGGGENSAAWCARSGGSGGKGGNGGHGGGGGGGCGGVSYGGYATGAQGIDLSPIANGNQFVAGIGGAAGTGGPSIGNPGGAGGVGTAEPTNF